MTSEPVNQPEQAATTPPAATETPKETAVSRPGIFSLTDMRAEMDRLWEAVMSGRWPRLTNLSSISQMPPIDVYEKDGQVHVRAELPGLKENEVDIEVDADGVVISGEKRDEREVKEENFYRSERSYGKFTRRIALPAGADAENATATFKNGVLEIDMPMKPEKGKKKIEVRS